MTHQTTPTSSPDAPAAAAESEKKFHGWRLIGIILCVVVVIALVSALVDWIVIGPLEGRAY